MKKIILIVMVLLILSGCVPEEEETIKIGGAFGLTGFASAWGEVDMNGALFAVEEVNKAGGVNGKNVELVVEDIISDSVKTVSAVQKLINVDNVVAIIGPTWLDTFGGAAPLADEYNVIMITPSASITAIKSEQKYENVFSTWYRTDKEAERLAEYLADAKQKKIALFFGNDPFWQDITNYFRDYAKENNLEILGDFKFNAGEKDFRTLLTKAKDLGVSAIFFGMNDEAGLFAFLKQREELYPESVLYTTEYIEEFAVEGSDLEDYLSGVYYASPAEADSSFAQKYKERFNKQPLFSASNSYDATKILLEAIEKTDTASAENLRMYIMTNEFETATFGTVRFDDIGGLVGGKFVIKSAEERKIVG